MVIALNNIELTKFFLAIVLLILFAYLFGYIFNKFKMPKVVGEIFGGILLGPTFLGYFFPDLYNFVFLQEGKLLAVIYWLGLILLMFCSGFELHKNFNKNDKKIITLITISSTIIPLIVGFLLASFFDISSLIGNKNNLLALKLVIAVAIAITLIPIISKIFFDLNIIKTRFARIVLSIATIHDVVLWVFVAIATGLVSSSGLSFWSIFWNVILSLSFFAFVLLLIPKLINFIRSKKVKIPKNYELGFAIFLLLLFVILTIVLNVNIIFGAFLAGIVISFLKSQKFKKVKTHVKEFSFAFFIPIYFSIVGIKLDLIHNFDLLFFVGLFFLAILTQGFAVILASKLLKFNWLSSFNLAMAMNARGGPGIVLATVAFDSGIINDNFFVSLIVLSIATSLLAGVWLRFVISKNLRLLN